VSPVRSESRKLNIKGVRVNRRALLQGLVFVCGMNYLADNASSQEVVPAPVVAPSEADKTSVPSDMTLMTEGLRMTPKCKKEEWAEGMPKYEAKLFEGQMSTACEFLLTNRPGNLVTLEEATLKQILAESTDVHQAPQSTDKGTMLEITRKFKFGKTELVARQVIVISRTEDSSFKINGQTKEFIEGKAGSVKLVDEAWNIEINRAKDPAASGKFLAVLTLEAKVQKPGLAPQGLFMSKAKDGAAEAFQIFVESSLADLDRGL
jgi:hypothetical protein